MTAYSAQHASGKQSLSIPLRVISAVCKLTTTKFSLFAAALLVWKISPLKPQLCQPFFGAVVAFSFQYKQYFSVNNLNTVQALIECAVLFVASVEKKKKLISHK